VNGLLLVVRNLPSDNLIHFRLSTMRDSINGLAVSKGQERE
jgi:hypothetical protein